MNEDGEEVYSSVDDEVQQLSVLLWMYTFAKQKLDLVYLPEIEEMMSLRENADETIFRVLESMPSEEAYLNET